MADGEPALWFWHAAYGSSALAREGCGLWPQGNIDSRWQGYERQGNRFAATLARSFET